LRAIKEKIYHLSIRLKYFSLLKHSYISYSVKSDCIKLIKEKDTLLATLGETIISYNNIYSQFNNDLTPILENKNMNIIQDSNYVDTLNNLPIIYK
jgi:hypothetical protein